MDVSEVLKLLKPVLVTEGQKIVDGIMFPELESLINAKVTDPVLKQLALSLLPILKAAADAEIAKLAA